ncbi:MAG: hypothetical protein NTZ09_03035 [Candidatus Hydrogenedentes bacterium]|nr:hypothetical protein [Candidatus Hydrogenedentota bacterium]
MDTRRAVRIAALVVLLCFVLALAVEYADAAPAKAGKAVKAKGDQSLAQKKGISGSLGTKKTDETKKATKLQMMIGVGSVFVAFAVIKWL